MAKGFNIRAWLGLDTKDYEKGISKAKRQTKQFGKGLQTTMRGATQASMGFLNKMTGGAVSGFQNMFRGVQQATRGMKGFRAALISTGIGALVVALGSLVAYFTQTKAGADMVSKGMAAFGAVMDAISERIAKIGGAIVKLFKGDFKGAAEEARGAFSGIGDQIADNYKKSKELSDREAKLKRDQINWITQEKKLEEEISELRMKSQDKERFSAKERENFEKQAQKLIKEKGEESLRLLDEEIALLKARQAQGNNTYEDDKALAELEARRLDSQRGINDQIRQSNTRLNSVRKETEKIAETAAREAEERKKALEHTIELGKRLNDISLSSELDDQFDFVTPLEAYEEKLKELREAQAKAWTTDQFLEYQKEIETTENRIKEFKGEFDDVGDSIQSKNNEIGESFSRTAETISSAFNVAENSFAGFALALMQTLPQLHSQLDILASSELSNSRRKVASKQAEAMASGTAEAAKAPWFMAIPLIAGIIGTIGSVFNSLPKFESGGILGGNSLTGDKLLFRGNSGEMILNKQQQGNLFRMINQGGSGSGGEVEFKIKGQELVGVLSNTNRRTNSYR